MPLTFEGDSVMPKQTNNKTGNTSQMLFRQNNKAIGEVKPLAPMLEKTNPFQWNSVAFGTVQEPGQGFDDRFKGYMQQAKMSTYYQDHPWEVLQFSKKHGLDGPQPGGQIRGDIPPGHFPGNTLKPNKVIASQMINKGTIEGFGNVNFKFGSGINWN